MWSSYRVFESLLAEGQVFLGFPTLAAMAQRPEYHAMVSVLCSTIEGEGNGHA